MQIPPQPASAPALGHSGPCSPSGCAGSLSEPVIDGPTTVLDSPGAAGSVRPRTPLLDAAASLPTIPCRRRPPFMAGFATALLGAIWRRLTLTRAGQPNHGDLGSYIPVLSSAVLFGVPTGLAARTSAALLAGPLSPADEHV